MGVLIMALNFTPQDVGSGYSSEAVLDENFDNIQTALADGLSRSGNTPNAMGATLDMNSNRIINLPAPQSSNDAARYADILNGVETSDAVLPAQAGNTTRFLSTDGTNWVFKDIMDDEDLYDISLTDSEARTLKGKLDEVISVKDFGATGDGVTDDSTALTAAFTAGAWFFPKGTYKVSSDITLTGFKMFAPGASISVDLSLIHI